MKSIKFILPILVVIVLLTGCSRHKKVETDEFTLNHIGKTKVRLENIHGDIIIHKWDSTAGFIIKAERIASVRKRDLDKPLSLLRVNIDTSDSEILIESIYEKERGIFKLQFGDNKINYKIYLPDNLTMNIENVNGEIEIYDCSNDFNVENVNGKVLVKNLTGNNKFDLVNGKFEAFLDSVKGLNVESVNGSITLNLDSSFKGGFDAEWVNGKFNNEGFAFNVSETDKKHFRGFINEKQPEIKLQTVNGKITILKK
jgi:DUF4097 and DUF4098 domain-containing protein YvlB